MTLRELQVVAGTARAAALIVVVGCGFETRSDEYRCDPSGGCEDGRVCVGGWCVVESGSDDGGGVDGVVTDANGDSSVVDADCAGAPIDFEPSNFGRCDIPTPPSSIDLSGGNWSLDTDTGELRALPGGTPFALASRVFTQSAGPEILIVAVDSLVVPSGSRLRVEGSRPLALVSAGDAVIDGRIVARTNGATPGPGGGIASVCGAGTGAEGEEQTTSNNRDGGSGGGGGGYGSAGGEGAIVDGSPGSVSPAGEVNGSAQIVPLRGGCNGGVGGLAVGGLGGGGGGAIQLVAATSITVATAGLVTARGGGGQGVSGAHGGGGGGGSGGALLLEAHAITIAGFLTAHGGGGGEGARAESPSEPGESGHTGNLTPAAGGAGASAGGDGGAGAVEGTAAEAGFAGTSSIQDAAGGGGGGGGVGRIRLRSLDGAPTVTGTVSPAP